MGCMEWTWGRGCHRRAIRHTLLPAVLNLQTSLPHSPFKSPVSCPTSLSPVGYYPFGIQKSVPISTLVNGGWSLCYSVPYSAATTSADIRSCRRATHVLLPRPLRGLCFCGGTTAGSWVEGETRECVMGWGSICCIPEMRDGRSPTWGICFPPSPCLRPCLSWLACGLEGPRGGGAWRQLPH